MGLTKSIGVSNFNVQLIADILTYAKHRPVLNQTEIHPLNTQSELVRFLKDQNILPVAYCPLGRPAGDEDYTRLVEKPDLRNYERLIDIGKSYGKSVLQVVLRWSIQRGCAVVPKATKEEHQRENLDVFDFILSEGEMDYISSLN